MKLSLVEVVFRLAPEVLFINYFIMKLSHNKYDKKKYSKSCIAAILCVYIIRSLPISYGIHIILNVLTFVGISILINKYDVVATISSIIIIFVIMIIIEELNMLIITCISKELVNYILSDGGAGKTILGIPSIIAYTVISFVFYKKSKKGDKL